MYVYIYIYIERERDRKREVKRYHVWLLPAPKQSRTPSLISTSVCFGPAASW